MQAIEERKITRGELPVRTANAYLVYVRDMIQDGAGLGFLERLHFVCTTHDDAVSIADALCDLFPEWQYTEPKAFAESLPFTTFARYANSYLLERAKAKLSEAELEAIRAELRGEL